MKQPSRTSRPHRDLPSGKLPVSVLRRRLAKLTSAHDSGVVVGPGIGLDAAAVMPKKGYLVVKTDPITMVAKDIGRYALVINANDLATMGATARWFLATILLPARGTSESRVSRIFSDLDRACRQLGVSLCGGHTEITDAVTRPVVVGCLLGECSPNRLVTAAGAKKGDGLLLTKGIPIEAVSVLARELGRELERRYSLRFVARCHRYVSDPGISVVRDARIAQEAGGVHAMHDPTEGGLSTALYELAEASGVGLEIDEEAVPVLPEARRLCTDLGIDPLGAIASGALLLSVDPGREQRVLRNLHGEHITCSRIGTVISGRGKVSLKDSWGRRRPMPKFQVDELSRFFESGGPR